MISIDNRREINKSLKTAYIATEKLKKLLSPNAVITKTLPYEVWAELLIEVYNALIGIDGASIWNGTYKEPEPE